MPGPPSSSVLRPHGIVIVTGVDGQSYQSDALTCCHCGTAWVVRRGSGIRRGFCAKCGNVTCGAPECDPCLPIEKRLDLFEAGKLDHL